MTSKLYPIVDKGDTKKGSELNSLILQKGINYVVSKEPNFLLDIKY